MLEFQSRTISAKPPLILQDELIVFFAFTLGAPINGHRSTPIRAIAGAAVETDKAR